MGLVKTRRFAAMQKQQRAKALKTCKLSAKPCKLWPKTLQASGETLQAQAENLARLPEIKKLTDNLKKHISRENFEKLLCALCQGRELEAPLIARLIRRNETYVRTFLTRLVACKRLQYKYPEMPTHPHQAYTAAKQR